MCHYYDSNLKLCVQSVLLSDEVERRFKSSLFTAVTRAERLIYSSQNTKHITLFLLLLLLFWSKPCFIVIVYLFMSVLYFFKLYKCFKAMCYRAD